MATASSDSLSKDRQECPICLEVFTSPRQLSCLHSFCEHCLQDYITKNAGGIARTFDKLICPVCRTVTMRVKKDKPVGEWASLFPQSPITLVGESKVKVDKLCNVCSSECSSSLATKFCVICEEFMCDSCSRAHANMKMSRSHQMITVEDLEHSPNDRLKWADGFGCQEHDDKEIEFYCRDHDTACCSICSFLNHKMCSDVLLLKTDLLDLLKEIHAQEIMEKMRQLEKYLEKFMDANESELGMLEIQVDNIPALINKTRNRFNSMLDDVEKIVKSEGNRIYKEELIRKQERRHQCQSLMNAIRNSHALLEMVSRHGTDIQKFVVTKTTSKQLQLYVDKVREKFELVEYTRLNVVIDNYIKALLSKDAKELVKIACNKECKRLPCDYRPLRERTVEMSRVIDIHSKNDKNRYFTGVVQLIGGNTILVDRSKKTCCLFDPSYNTLTNYTLPGSPHDLCLMDCTEEVAVTMPDTNTVQFLSITDRCIRSTGKITTKYECYGVAAVSRQEIVVSGIYGRNIGCTCYWSLILKDGTENLHRKFHSCATSQAYVALDTPKTRVYISVGGGNSVYCFGLSDGRQYFIYTSENLKYPLGIAVDRESNVYVVGYASNNIHKLSPDGAIIQVITSGVPENPSRISFNQSKDQFIITNQRQKSSLYHFVHI